MVAGGWRNSRCGLCPSPCQLFHVYLHLSASLTGTHSGYSMPDFVARARSTGVNFNAVLVFRPQGEGDRPPPPPLPHELRRSRGRGHCTVSPRPTLPVSSLWSAPAVRRDCSSAAETAFVGALLLGCGERVRGCAGGGGAWPDSAFSLVSSPAVSPGLNVATHFHVEGLDGSVSVCVH